METPTATKYATTIRKSNQSPFNELPMLTIPDLDELTWQRSTRDWQVLGIFDTSVSTVVSRIEFSKSGCTSVILSMICLVTVGSIMLLPACTSMCSKVVYYTQ